jgi:protein phosphatase
MREGAGGWESLQHLHDDILDLADFTGRRVVETRSGSKCTIAAENAAAALEVMSRYAVHPRWLMYLPPTMSPVETAHGGVYLERPEEAFSYFGVRGVATVVCQEKHMGSRAVLVVCRTPETARRRFGATGGEQGVVVTRTGRAFFNNAEETNAILTETARAWEEANLWEELDTDWCCIDAEIMPWNAKARGLLRDQYAPVAGIGRATLQAEYAAAIAAAERGVPGTAEVAARLAQRLADLNAYADAYARYCWPVEGLNGLKIAPFHLLAVEGRTLLDRDHHWHIATLGRLAAVAPQLFHATDTLTVETGDPESVSAGVAWWETKTGAGGEGMVVKPLDFLPPSRCQPAMKVRGREYLRIIYGPEYTDPANLDRLRRRNVGGKRALAAREFMLGVEGLERFVAREPLRRVHECVFGVLALESEPVDPRL